MNRRLALYALVGLMGLMATVGLIYLALVTFLSEPVERAYQLVVRLVELAPQDWIWAGLIGLIVLISLRNLASRSSEDLKEGSDSEALFQREGLESWLELLQQRTRGSYFQWRLASRLAELDHQLGEQSARPSPPEIEAYLQMGRDRRTIHSQQAAGGEQSNVEQVISYLEQRMEIEREG